MIEGMAASGSGPRRFIKAGERNLFGRSLHVTWPESPGSEAERLAAYRQHLLAYAVTDARGREPKISLLALAEHLGGTSPETLRRKIRGEGWISWVDAATLTLAFPDQQIMPDHDVTVPTPNW